LRKIDTNSFKLQIVIIHLFDPTQKETAMKIGLSIASTLIVILLLAAPALASPKFTFEKNVHDFDNVTQGRTVAHTFTFRNTGDAPGTIARVSSSCG